MNSRLDDRIRDLMQQVAEESPPPPTFPIGPAVAPRTRRRVPGWAVAVGAAVLTIALIGGAAWLLAGSTPILDPVDQPPPPDTIAPTTLAESQSEPTVTTPTPNSTIPDLVGDSAWTRVVTDREVFGEVLLSGVVTIGDLLVVYGETATGEEEYLDGSGKYTVGSPTVWVSNDAEAWTLADVSAPVPQGEIVVGGPGLVSIAIVDGSPVSWLSTDGVSWTENPLDREVFADWELCEATHPPNFDETWSAGPVVIAHHKYLCGPAHYPGRVWVTADGYEWTSLQPDAFGEDWPNGWDTTLTGGSNSDNWRINDVDGTDNAIVAVGEDLGPAIWFSADGYSWDRIEVEPGEFAGEDIRIWEVATDGTRFIAMGSTGGEFVGDVLVWVSPDGQDWSTDPFTINSSLGEVRELTAYDDGYVALGWNGTLWTSPQGTFWEKQATTPSTSGLQISGITVDGSMFYVTGYPTFVAEDDARMVGAWEPLLFYWQLAPP